MIFSFSSFSAIIIPLLNGFIKHLHGDESVIGLALSAMSFSGLISAPVFGRVTDYIGKTKTAVIVADIFAIGGMFIGFVLIGNHLHNVHSVPQIAV